MPRGPMRNVLLGLLVLLSLALLTVAIGLPDRFASGSTRTLLEICLAAGIICCLILGWLGWRQGRRLTHLEQSGQHHLQMLESVPEALLVLDAGSARVVNANSRCHAIFGRAPESLSGLPVSDLLPALRLPDAHSSDTNHGIGQQQTHALRSNGAKLPVDVGLSQFAPATDAALQFIVSVRDARSRVEIETARRDAEARIRHIIQSVPGVVYRCAMDANWTMEFVSDPVEALTGYPPNDFIGNRRISFGDLIHPDDAPKLQPSVEAAANSNQPWLVEYRIQHRDGHVRWIMEHGNAHHAPDGSIAWLYGVMMDVTDLKEAERSVAETQQRLAEITENLPGATWRVEIDRQTRQARFTHFAGRLDLPHDDLNLAEIRQDAHSLLSLVHPDDRERYLRDVEQGIESERYTSEYRTRRHDGRWVWVRANGSVFDSADGQTRIAVGHTIDVDAERKLQQALEDARADAESQAQRLSRLTDNLPGVVWEIRLDPPDLTPKFTYVSDTAQIAIGLAPDEFYSDFEQIASFVHADDRALFDQQIDRLRTAAADEELATTFQHRMRTPEQTYVWRRTAFRGVISDDGSRTVYGLTIDIHREKTLEQDLRLAREDADRANAAKSEFLANMSHEIRTPMNAVVGMAHLMRGTDLTRIQGRYLAQIESSSRQLLHLLDDILDLAKIEAGHLTVDATPFELHQLIDDLSSLMGARSQEKRLELSIRLSDDCPNRLVGDSLRISQVLNNLVSNAIKFTPDGGEIEVSVAAVWRNTSQSRLRFAVTDTGIGLSTEQQRRVFNVFEQADASTTRQFGGTGLGLAIARRLVMLMSGTIGVSSSPGAGSRFWFELELQHDHSAQREAAPDWLRGRRALVVDDHPTACEVITGLLARFGVRAVAAPNCAQGLARLRAAQDSDEPYDLLIVDWRLPDHSGTELIQQVIRAPNRYGKPHTVMTTAYGSEHALPGVSELKLDGFLIKPVSPGRLLEAITGSDSAEPSPSDRPALPHRPLASLSGLHILVVEDNAINQEIAATLLRRAGATVSQADDGQQALDALQTQDGIDLVLMDCQMPVMDGFEATLRIRRLDGHEQLPIVAMTANAMAGDRERCLNAGMDGYLAKPLEASVLLETVAQHLGRLNPGAENTALSALPELPDFVLNDALRRLDGNQDLLADLLKRFKTEHCDVARQIQQALIAGTADQARLLAHSLRGAASSLGAYHIAEQAQAVEAAIATGDELEPPLQVLAQTLKQTHQMLDDLTAALPTKAHTPSPETLARHWQRLERFLQEHDTRAVDLAATLDTLLPPDMPPVVAQVTALTASYDFVGARQAMEQVDLQTLLSGEEDTL